MIIRAFFTAFLLLSSSMVAQANTFTYEFNLSYSYSSSNPEFGTGAIIDLTLDNGNTTNISQQYTLTDITSVTVSTLNYGGTFRFTSNGEAFGSGFGQSYEIPYWSILTTDSSGNGTLGANTSDPSVWGFYTLGQYPNMSQAALFLGGGYYADIGLIDWNTGQGICYPSCGANFFVSTTPVTQTPIPPTLWLVGSALAGLTGLRSRKTSA